VETSLSYTLIYTGALHGDLDLLPRLYTFLRALRAEYGADRTLTFDIGEACVPNSWHCEVTGGRSMPIALDGMGFDAVNVSAMFSDEARAKINESVRIALVDDDHPYEADDLRLETAPSDVTDLRLHVRLIPAADTALDAALDSNVLHLRGVSAGEIGIVTVRRERGTWTLISAAVYAMPPNTRPDPTIAAVVEFVVSEAKYAQKRKEQKGAADHPE